MTNPLPRSLTRRAALLCGAVGVALATSACSAPGINHSAKGPDGKPVACSPARMKTVTNGKLTIATDNPALEPWFVANNPSSGEGFESGIGYDVAVALGYSPHNVVWRRASFSDIIAAGPKTFDFALDEVTIRPERQKKVDFSGPYFDVTQAVVAKEKNRIAKVRTIPELRGARLGAMAGTTSYAAILQVIKPTVAPVKYPSMSAAIAAVQAGKIDALVTDLPTAFYIAQGDRLVDSTVIGQLPARQGAEQVAAVLPKGSTNTPCISAAIDKIRADGKLDFLRQRWLVYKGAPLLKDN